MMIFLYHERYSVNQSKYLRIVVGDSMPFFYFSMAIFIMDIIVYY